MGTSVGSRWGVEAEAAWGGGRNIRPPGGLHLVSGDQFFFSVVTSVGVRVVTLTPALWVEQSVAKRLSLRYLAGLAFWRERDVTAITVVTGFANRTTTLPPTHSTSVTYDAAPVVGIEAAVKFTEHLRVVPGVRLAAIRGWLIRPTVGVAWVF